MEKPTRILMVCLGNICRSPLAQGILRDKINKEGVNAEVDSAGTSAYHLDEAPDPRSISTGRKNGINISDLRGRQFTSDDFDHFDKIYVMDLSNKENVLKLARHPEDEQKVELLLNETEPESDAEVPDPYFGGERGFDAVYEMIDRATDTILQKLKNGKL